MSRASNDQGRAYEYAWITALKQALSTTRKTKIVQNSSLIANQNAWDVIDDDMKELLEISANAAVDTILELEPLMSEDGNDELLLEFQKDEAGVKGDVRDIIIKRDNIKWKVGLSIKHNHEAVKHSRLSRSLDFGNEWYGVPCTDDYWNDVNPVFNRLLRDKQEGKRWSDLTDKEDSVYVPLLRAFMAEINRVYKEVPSISRKMVEYLIGTEDYYKVVSRDAKRMTLIHTFNINGTLNKPSKIKMSAINVPRVNLPTELIMVKLKTGSKNKVEMYLNNGWELSFRIHNASAIVEPSLKFDIQFIGMPISILNIECKWRANA